MEAHEYAGAVAVLRSAAAAQLRGIETSTIKRIRERFEQLLELVQPTAEAAGFAVAWLRAADVLMEERSAPKQAIACAECEREPCACQFEIDTSAERASEEADAAPRRRGRPRGRTAPCASCRRVKCRCEPAHAPAPTLTPESPEPAPEVGEVQQTEIPGCGSNA